MLHSDLCYSFNFKCLHFHTGIDFEEFLGMYKRLFLQCRTIVAGDVEDIVSPSHHKSDVSSGKSAKVRGRVVSDSYCLFTQASPLVDLGAL